MTEPTTVTAIKAQQQDSRIAHAMDRLLRKLKPFMRAYPHNADDMPDHDMGWTAGVGDDNPQAVIANALKATPALWMALLPDEVCIVSKSALQTLAGANPHLAENLALMGKDIVEMHGLRLLHEEREREYERRSRTGT